VSGVESVQPPESPQQFTQPEPVAFEITGFQTPTLLSPAADVFVDREPAVTEMPSESIAIADENRVSESIGNETAADYQFNIAIEEAIAAAPTPAETSTVEIAAAVPSQPEHSVTANTGDADYLEPLPGRAYNDPREVRRRKLLEEARQAID
ncbi:MAG: hypothetical protein WD772_08615, partial [Pseudohongiellaceae bacterium]